VVIYGAWKQYPVEESYLSSAPLPGPTVALNVQREDGSFVGYNEVSKLAATNSSSSTSSTLIHHPPIQFRTGCFCNPGACQQALGLTDEQAIDNFETAGHVCGDHIDLVHGQPTGAIRISFGKDSLWEDLDAFVVFIETTFVSRTAREKSTKAATSLRSRSPTKVELSELYLFPIKSCSAQRVSRWRIELPSGKLVHDREFALVDTSGTAMRLQTCPKMGMIVPSIDLLNQTMTISAPGRDDLVVNLAVANYHDSGHTIVKVCGNKCGGRLWGEYAVSEWFSSFLGVQCWLARFSNGEYQMPQQHRANGSPLVVHPRVGFANEEPILLISENAVGALNQVLEEQHQTLVGSRHFRPNLVVKSIRDDGCHIEDEWKILTLLTPNVTLRFEVKGSCARCTMIDYDPMTGKKGKTLSALAKYRRRNGQITFGIFLRAMAQNSDNKEIWIEEGDDLLCT
jgi:molybdenum cofactor sulfurtransferase